MKTLDEVIDAVENCYCLTEPIKGCDQCPYYGECNRDGDPYRDDVLHYLKAYRDAKNALDAERERTIEAYCQWEDAKEKLEAQTSQMMWVDKHFQFEISDNPPLTWDELKAMEGKPVWVEMDKPDVIKAWFLICQIDNSFVWVADSKGKSHNFPRVCLDTGLWQAYRKER